MSVTLRKPIVFHSSAHRYIADGEAISVKHGGTGLIEAPNHSLILGSSTNHLTSLAAVATTNTRVYLSQYIPDNGPAPEIITSWRTAANLYSDIKPSITSDFVPFTGASKNVNLNAKALTNVASLGVGVANLDAVVHVVHEQTGAPFLVDKYIDDPAGAHIQMRKARGSYSSPAAAQNNDVGGGFITQLHDGANFGQAAAIRVRATQNQSPSKHGAKIVFETVANDTVALTERMVIQHDGKIGIGTTDPLHIFHVHNEANPAHIYISSTRESAGAAASFNLLNTHTGSYTRLVHRLYGSPLREQSLLTIYDADNSSFNQLYLFDLLDKSWTLGQGVNNIAIIPSGNVGIGTANPQKTLHVQGTMRLTQAAPVNEVKGIMALTTGGDVLTVTPTAYTLQRAYLSQIYDGEIYETSWNKIQGSEIENALWLPLSGGTMSGYITLHADPLLPMHPASKQYVDALAAGLVPFPAVEAAEGRSNVNLSTSAQLTIDNYSVNNGESFLLTTQSNPVENGIYVATKIGDPSTWSYSRRSDANNDGDMFKALIPVKFGDTFAGAMFYCTAPDDYTVGLDPIPFIQFLFPVGAKPGAGLVLNGNLIELGTPSTITHLTNNAVTAQSHTHKLQLPTETQGDMLIAGEGNILTTIPYEGEAGKFKFLRQTSEGGERITGWREINAVHTKFTATNKILGRYSTGAGYAQEITVSTGISISGGNLINSLPMTYPGKGIALSTGSAWDTSITDNSDNWNTAYNWGNHAAQGYLKTETDPVFTTWKDTSRTQKHVFIAPNDENGAPTWRQINYSDISGTIPYTETDPIFTSWRDTSRTQSYVFAAPNDEDGAPTWRRLNYSDLLGNIPFAGHALNDHTDVIISSPVLGQTILYNGEGWENGDITTFIPFTALSGTGVINISCKNSAYFRYNLTGTTTFNIFDWPLSNQSTTIVLELTTSTVAKTITIEENQSSIVGRWVEDVVLDKIAPGNIYMITIITGGMEIRSIQWAKIG